MDPKKPDPVDIAQKTITAILLLEACPSWKGYVQERLDDRVKELIEESLSAKTVEEREAARHRVKEARWMRNFVADARRGAENVIAQEAARQQRQRPSPSIPADPGP